MHESHIAEVFWPQSKKRTNFYIYFEKDGYGCVFFHLDFVIKDDCIKSVVQDILKASFELKFEAVAPLFIN